jgi:hypothetical protein
MKLREFLIGSIMITFIFVSANAITVPLPSPLITEDKVLGSAYYDTLSILSANNECSDFFGGPSASVGIFNELMAKVRKTYLSSSIGIRMSGDAIHVFNMATKSKYRLFKNVSINVNGPFYGRKSSISQPSRYGIGTFKPNTKEARVLMFLHELGHIVKGQSGKWLLPDDGLNDAQSRDNTKKIEEVCGNQIKSLGKGDLAMNSASGKQKQAAETSTPAVTKP